MEMTAKEAEEKLEKELWIQHQVNEDQSKHQLQQEEEIEAAAREQQQQDEEWYLKKREFEKPLRENQVESINKEKPVTTSPQSVKLQKYTITPFTGEYKDWLRFWNQFIVEIDGSSIAAISKFNYLLVELVKEKPGEDILGLPHTPLGYEEATHGKDIKVHKALIKELEELPTISSIHKLHAIREFHNKLLRIVHTLMSMKKLTTAQSMVYMVMDKLGPSRKTMTGKNGVWRGLLKTYENLQHYEWNPLRNVEDRRKKSSTSRIITSHGEEGKRQCFSEIWKGQDQAINRLSFIATQRNILGTTALEY